MAKINDGGPAFPQHVAPAYRQEPEIWGMSLRDWFAGQALAGLLAFDAEANTWVGDAENAYKAADSMLAARAGKEEANVALITAAPDMLAALKAAVAMIEDSMRDTIHPAIGRFVPGVTDLELAPDGSVTLCGVRALIAKAEGRADA